MMARRLISVILTAILVLPSLYLPTFLPKGSTSSDATPTSQSSPSASEVTQASSPSCGLIKDCYFQSPYGTTWHDRTSASWHCAAPCVDSTGKYARVVPAKAGDAVAIGQDFAFAQYGAYTLTFLYRKDPAAEGSGTPSPVALFTDGYNYGDGVGSNYCAEPSAVTVDSSSGWWRCTLTNILPATATKFYIAASNERGGNAVPFDVALPCIVAYPGQSWVKICPRDSSFLPHASSAVVSCGLLTNCALASGNQWLDGQHNGKGATCSDKIAAPWFVPCAHVAHNVGNYNLTNLVEYGPTAGNNPTLTGLNGIIAQYFTLDTGSDLQLEYMCFYPSRATIDDRSFALTCDHTERTALLPDVTAGRHLYMEETSAAQSGGTTGGWFGLFHLNSSSPTLSPTPTPSPTPVPSAKAQTVVVFVHGIMGDYTRMSGSLSDIQGDDYPNLLTAIRLKGYPEGVS